jgi:hypothetical protein
MHQEYVGSMYDSHRSGISFLSVVHVLAVLCFCFFIIYLTQNNIFTSIYLYTLIFVLILWTVQSLILIKF